MRWMMVVVLLSVLSGAVFAPAAALAAASEGAAAGHGERESMFSGDFGNVFWTALIFLGLVTVLARYAWRPMIDTLNRREQFIRQTIETARQDRAEAERLMEEYRGRITRARQEAQAIIDQGRQDAELARQQLHQQAQKEAEQMIARARQEIDLARQAALHDLQGVAADLSVAVAGKVIQRNLSPGDQRRLVEESLRQLVHGNGDGMNVG